LSDASSMTVNQLDLPSLHSSFPSDRRHQPARGRGVMCGAGAGGRAEQNPHTAPALRGQLDATGLDPREFCDRSDDGRHALASQTFGDGPGLIGEGLGTEQEKLVERDTQRRYGRGVKFCARVAPDDGAFWSPLPARGEG
jgi:hypothetical protein